ncbi:MAG: CPBP family intramembrane glutamic endopeptidase [Anaerolineales bacterium]
MAGVLRMPSTDQQEKTHKGWILLELLPIALLALLRIPFLTIIILIICFWRIYRRNLTWEYLGFDKRDNILRTMIIGLIIAVVYQAFSIFLLVPVLDVITQSRLDLSEITALRGNGANFLIAIILSWTLAAFGEEIAYRSYLYHLLEDLFDRKRFGVIAAVVICTFLFTLGHGYQGISGILENLFFGLAMAMAFLFSGKNLWLPVFIHGFVDTIGFILIFSGVYP